MFTLGREVYKFIFHQLWRTLKRSDGVVARPSLARLHVAVLSFGSGKISVKPRYRRSAGVKGLFPTTAKASGLSRSLGLQAKGKGAPTYPTQTHTRRNTVNNANGIPASAGINIFMTFLLWKSISQWKQEQTLRFSGHVHRSVQLIPTGD